MGSLFDLIMQLSQAAKPRPDLLGADQGGAAFGSPGYAPAGSEQQKPYTFAGRVLTGPPPPLNEIMARPPIAELESGGRAMMAPADMMAGLGDG